MRAMLCMIVLWSTGAFGDDLSSRAKLEGGWQADGGAKDAGAWTLQSKGEDVLHVTHSVGEQKLAEFECSTKGRDCDVQDSGKPAKVSMWFNGPMLVELETRGREVVKRRFAVKPAGDTLDLEIIPIAPAGKAETLHLRRVTQ